MDAKQFTTSSTSPVSSECSMLREPSSHSETNVNTDCPQQVRALEINARLPRCVRFDDEPEASAYCILSIGLTCSWSVILFLTTAMLKVANQEAGCDNFDDSTTLDNCDKLIYGLIKPSSLITVLATISLAGTAITMPVVGSIVDNSHHRQKLGLYSSFAVGIISFIFIFLNQDALPFFAFLFLCFGFSLASANVCGLAYLVDWKKDPSTMSKYQTRFHIAIFLSYIGSVLMIAMASLVLNLDELVTARIGQVIATFSAMMATYTWVFLFSERKAVKTLPEGTSILRAGFHELRNTFIGNLRTDPVTISFLAHVSFSRAASTSVVAISNTFMVHALKMSPGEVGAASVLFAASAVPGSKIGEIVSRRRDPFQSLRLNTIMWCIFIPLGAVVLDGRARYQYVYPFCIIWGAIFGWSLPVGLTAYISILPRDCRPTEMIGLLIFSSNFLSWIPTFLFTLINESNVDMRIALGSLSIFYYISLGILVYFVGDFEHALVSARGIQSHLSSDRSDEESSERHTGNEQTQSPHVIVESLSPSLQ